MRLPLAPTAALLICGLCAAAPVRAIQFGTSHDLLALTDLRSDMRADNASVGDTNGDGRADIFVYVLGESMGHTDKTEDFVGFLFEQQADGTMRQSMRFTLAPGGTPRYGHFASALGDLDADGRAELVLTEPDGAIAILERNADGPFEQVARLPGYFRSEQLQVEDLDGDGFPEILSYWSDSGLAIYPGRGPLQFGAPVSVQTLHSAYLALADADGDGRRDLLGTAMDYGGVGINFGYAPRAGGYANGAGPDRYGFFRSPFHADRIPADVVSAGRFGPQARPALFVNTVEGVQPGPNLIELWQTLSVYTRDAGGEWQLAMKKRYEDIGSVMTAPLRVQDLDGDGLDDVVVFRDDRVDVLMQTASGFADVLTPVDNRPSYLNPPRYGSAHIVDFNGDGCLDLGYMSRSYTIHYRTDCPTATTARPRPAASAPAVPAPRIKPRRGNRLRR